LDQVLHGQSPPSSLILKTGLFSRTKERPRGVVDIMMRSWIINVAENIVQHWIPICQFEIVFLPKWIVFIFFGTVVLCFFSLVFMLCSIDSDAIFPSKSSAALEAPTLERCSSVVNDFGSGSVWGCWFATIYFAYNARHWCSFSFFRPAERFCTNRPGRSRGSSEWNMR
jgi:hypothetical protein